MNYNKYKSREHNCMKVYNGSARKQMKVIKLLPKKTQTKPPKKEHRKNKTEKANKCTGKIF